MTTTSNIFDILRSRTAGAVFGLVFGTSFISGLLLGHSIMKHECASIMTANLPIPPVSIIYLSRGE